VAGREVVQLYVTLPAVTSTGDVWRPERELNAFTKVPIVTPGEEQEVALKVELDIACSY
jgi:hypothetical protein